jgi:hypothetical protein
MKTKTNYSEFDKREMKKVEAISDNFHLKTELTLDDQSEKREKIKQLGEFKSNSPVAMLRAKELIELINDIPNKFDKIN